MKLLQAVKNIVSLIKVSFKNLKYGRQSISRPLRIVAPIPQNTEFFEENKKNHEKRKTSKTSRNMPKLAINPSTRGL